MTNGGMKSNLKNNLFSYFVSGFIVIVCATFPGLAQDDDKYSGEMWSEVKSYVQDQRLELLQTGKKISRRDIDKLGRKQKKLARKYAEMLALRPNLELDDYFYLGMLCDVSGDRKMAFEATRKYLEMAPEDTDSFKLQSVRKGHVIFAARIKNFDAMERVFSQWIKGEMKPGQRPGVENVMARFLYKSRQYEKSVKYAESAWEGAKNTPARNLSERRKKDKFYGELVEVLSMSYRKAKRKDDALKVLAEGRAMSFTIPSARLYRKVMDLVEGFRISERRLMEKVESFDTTELAPELNIEEWIGREGTTLEELRGKVVLLDFWYTWCEPCISTFPRLRGWHKKYSDQGLVIIGVTGYMGMIKNRRVTQLQEYDYIEEFKRKYKLPYGFAIQSRRRTEELEYGVFAYPTTVLIDRKGIIRYIGIGAGSEENRNLGRMMKKVINEGQLVAQENR